MHYEPRHRAKPGTSRRLRRSMLSTTLATMALTTATGGSAAFAHTGAVTRPATPFGPTSPAPYSTPSLSAWDDPVVVTSSRRTDTGSRADWRVDADRLYDIPGAALAAYQRAATVLNEASPGCRLRWTLLAAVGRVLTDHGQRGDRRVDDQGTVRPGIVGKPVLARGGRRVSDTDAGLLDEDRRFDRPVGPMLLTPADWSVVGVDGDADGKRKPQDLDDASLALAVLLCARGDDLRTAAGQRTALRRINDDPGFVRAVLAVNAAYRRQLRSGVEPVEVVPLTTVPTIPTMPTPPTAKPTDRTPQSDPAEDNQAFDQGDQVDQGHQGLGDQGHQGPGHQGHQGGQGGQVDQGDQGDQDPVEQGDQGDQDSVEQGDQDSVEQGDQGDQDPVDQGDQGDQDPVDQGDQGDQGQAGQDSGGQGEQVELCEQDSVDQGEQDPGDEGEQCDGSDPALAPDPEPDAD